MLATGPDALTRQAARRIGLPATVGFGAYGLTNAAIDKFGWEDNLKNFGGSIYDFINPKEETNRNLFNAAVPGLNFAKNILGFKGTPETFQQEEWMKNKLLEKVRNSGSLSGTMTYDDYGSKVNPTGGIFGAPFAYSNSLGQSDYSIPQQGGQVDFAKSGTAYNFEPGDLPGKMGEVVTNIVNRGGLLGKGTPQHYTPNITITPREIQNIFGGGQMVHKGEPTITQPTITQPTVQPVTQPTNEPTITPPPTPAAPVIPTYNPPQGPAGYTQPPVTQPTTRSGTSATALAQIQANIEAAKTKSTVLPKPVKATPLSGPAGYSKPTTQSASPAPRSRARATRGRTAPVIRQPSRQARNYFGGYQR